MLSTNVWVGLGGHEHTSAQLSTARWNDAGVVLRVRKMERRSQSPLHTVLRSMMRCQTAQSSVPAQSGCSCMVLGNTACEKSLEGSRDLKSLLLIFASG